MLRQTAMTRAQAAVLGKRQLVGMSTPLLPMAIVLLLLQHMPAAAGATIRVDPGSVTHRISWSHGCHTDLGYSHQERGIYAQLLHGESFESMPEPALQEEPARHPPLTTTQWAHRASGGGKSGLTSSAPILNGEQAALLTAAAADDTAAVVNRGFWQEGLSLQEREYEGHVFARSAAGAKLTLAVSLEDSASSSAPPTTLASASLRFVGTGGWSRLNFTLTPSRATSCAAAPWGAAPAYCEPGLKDRVGAACLRCGGQLVLALVGPGSVVLDMAYLQEGESWGTLPGLPAKRSTVEWMQRLGIQSIRTGGTYVKIDQNEGGSNASIHGGAGYRWKAMRGPRELRPPVLQNGGGEPCYPLATGDIGWCGYLRSRGWGPIEAIILAERLNVTAMTTLGHTETPEDLADLVEYMFAQPVDSQWAALRVADGHAEPFNTDQYFEIGNEINTPDFGQKALAMEKAAVAAGVGGKLKYACPWQCLESLDDIVASGAKNLGAQVVFDLHTSTKPVDPETGVMAGTVMDARGLGAAVAKLEQAGMQARVGWWETNTGTLHDMSRAIMEARDTNNLDRNAAAYRLDTRTASFCTEYSGHDDLWLSKRGDQGLIFFSANMTWGQPPAHLHQLLSATAQPNALELTNDLNATLDAVAAASSDGTVVTVRVVNPTPAQASAAVALRGEWKSAALVATISVLAAPGGDPTAANSMASPDAVRVRATQAAPFEQGKPLAFPPMSVTVLEISRAAA